MQFWRIKLLLLMKVILKLAIYGIVAIVALASQSRSGLQL